MIVLIDKQRIFFSMEAYFQYRIDTDNAVHGYSVKTGDVIRVKAWAVYEVVEGKMGAVECCAVGDELWGAWRLGMLSERVRGGRMRGLEAFGGGSLVRGFFKDGRMGLIVV